MFNPWVGKIPWKRERLPTPVFWPGEFHGLYSPWGRKESDTTEQLSLSQEPQPSHTHTPTPLPVLVQPPPSIPKDQEGRTGEVVGTYPWFRRPPFPKTGVSLMTLLGVAPQTPQAVEATYATLLGGRSG